MAHIIKRTVGLTQDMWDHLDEDSTDERRPFSFLIREMVGKHFRIPKEKWHESREPKPARRRAGRGRA